MKAYKKNIDSRKPVPESVPAPQKSFTPGQDMRVDNMRNILLKARPNL